MQIEKKLEKSNSNKGNKSKKKARIQKIIFIPTVILIFIGLLCLNRFGPWLNTPFSKPPYLTWSQDTQTSIEIRWETPIPCSTVLAYGKNSTYNKIYYNSTPTMLHTVVLNGLDPGTTYHYKVYSKDFFVPYFLFDRTFKTAPNGTQEFSFVVYGDTRPDVFGITAHQTIINEILALNPDFVINVGDIVLSSNYLDQYDRFFYEIQYLAGTRPYMLCVGNHEAWEYGGNLLPYLYYLGSPNNKLWYSFNYSNAKFISLCVISNDQLLTPDQLQWLEKELQNANESQEIDWTFIYFHVPIYSAGGSYPILQAQLLPLINKYHVDFVISGHHHHYERLYIPNTHYLVTGGGGAELEFSIEKTPFTVVSQNIHCFSQFIVQNKTVICQCIDAQGNIIDWLAVTK
ncbi:MAG: metallophosphoesterase [Candidatus Helarchaeota archaeon]